MTTLDLHPASSDARAPRTGLAAAAAVIGEDLVSTLAYAGLYAITHDMRIALAVGVAAGGASIAWRRARGLRVDAMQWMSLALVLVFGGLGLGFHDPRFIMLKPTLAYVAVAAVMLKPGWMARYMPAPVQAHGADLVRGFERLWAAAMLLTAGANLVLAMHGDMATWAAFLAVAPISSKIVLVLLQYGVTRTMVRSRILRQGPAHLRSPAASDGY